MTSTLKHVAKKAIDWSFLLNSNTPLPKKAVSETLTKHQELQRLIFEAKEAKPTIYWSYYQAHLRPSDVPFIESCKKSITDFKPEALKHDDTIMTINKEEEQLVSMSTCLSIILSHW